MASIEDGKLIDKKVKHQIYAPLEHGDIKRIRAIVLHRTDSSTGASTLKAYETGATRGNGAHFLIDKDGKIYQTARLTKVCWHVGLLLPRCQMDKTCDPHELKTINALLHERGLKFSTRAKNIAAREARKPYPLRYPSNDDAFGVEVVGKFWPAQARFDAPTLSQLASVKWLVDTLVRAYGLDLRSDIYAHGAIARKEQVEGTELLQYLFSGAMP